MSKIGCIWQQYGRRPNHWKPTLPSISPRAALPEPQRTLLCLLIPIATLALSIHVVLGQQKEFDHQAAETGSIEGRVVGEQGEPITKAKLILYPGHGPANGAWPLVFSDSDGSFVFTRLKPGRYTVVAQKPAAGYPDMEDDFYNPHPLTWPYPIISVAEGKVTTGVRI